MPPRTTSSSASRRTRKPRPPASTTPARRSASSWSGVRSSASRAATPRRATAAGRSSAGRRRRPRRPARRPGSATGSCPRPARATAAQAWVSARRIASAVDAPSMTPRSARTSAQPADDLRGDDPGVAPGAEQRAVRERLRDGAQVGVRRQREDGGAGRLDGEVEVGAGVAVRDRVDVERVDLLAGAAESQRGCARPSAGRCARRGRWASVARLSHRHPTGRRFGPRAAVSDTLSWLP